MMFFRASRKKVLPFATVLISLILFSCATQKEVAERPPDRVLPKVDLTPPEKVLHCEEHTASTFNFSGISVLPFIKATFFDVDGDGTVEMITGSKDGLLRLYVNPGAPDNHHWKLKQDYFKGIHAGAFSSPALADLNGDSLPDVIVGTGGFSSRSGRILFFQNSGSIKRPVWKEIQVKAIDIGDDAAVAAVDYNFDGKPDVIAGNSEGKMFFFRNTSGQGTITFRRDKSLGIPRSLDKYAVPSAVKSGKKVVLSVGTSMGKLHFFEIRKNHRKVRSRKVRIDVPARRFLSPAFTDLRREGSSDLVLADGDGNISYHVNRKKDYSKWQQDNELFNNRLVAGPACAPTMTVVGNRTRLIVGNIDGNLRFYDSVSSSTSLPWKERQNYLKGIKVSGFSRAVLTDWKGEQLLITGESSGKIRAFFNEGTEKRPVWKEDRNFFSSLNSSYHSTPAAYDIDDDGMWELITGAEDGRIHAYRLRQVRNGVPVWEKIRGLFDHIRVRGFSAPSFARQGDALYLFVGQQDGSIRTFVARPRQMNEGASLDYLIFEEKDFLGDIKMEKHSSPFAFVNGSGLELVSGDYDGNIRHFRCREG